MIIEKNVITDLRKRRELECFPIINRGFLWYERLSHSQINELDEWYQKWLDVTVTGVVPIAPKWIYDKTPERELEEILI